MLTIVKDFCYVNTPVLKKKILKVLNINTLKTFLNKYIYLKIKAIA